MLYIIADVFREDPDFLANEEKYKELKNEIVDSSDSEDGGSGSDADSSSSDGEPKAMHWYHHVHFRVIHRRY